MRCGDDCIAAQTFTTLVNFDGSHGYEPSASLVQGLDGNLYGTTIFGGSSSNCAGGCGTIFKITPRGTLTILYSFCEQTNCADSSYPTASVVLTTDGNVYGTTVYGGAQARGTVFKITASGTLTSLYSFCAQTACTDGYDPYAALLLATDGNFYGTTTAGGGEWL